MEGARLEGRESWNSLQYLRQYPSENYGFKEFLERLRPLFLLVSQIESFQVSSCCCLLYFSSLEI